MAVKCASCGEELMGAVNCCWRCGHEFISQPGSTDLPPVRQQPVTPVPPEIADADTIANHGEAPSDFTVSSDASPVAVSATQDPHTAPPSEPPAPPPGYDRVGSPFATSSDTRNIAPQMAAPVTTAVEMPVYPRHAAAGGGAIASLVMGSLSAIGVLLLINGVFLTAVGVLLTSILGIGLGIWGTYSKRRSFAIAGLLICCLTLSISGFYCTQELYIAIYGRSPWTTLPAEEPLLDEVDSGY